jgi:hypothetical protein
MITCPACGKENEDNAYECRRCRAPFRDEPSLSQEMRALAISDEEAAEAGLSVSRQAGPAPADKTPPAAFAPPEFDSRPASEKACASCGAVNPPAAKFCFECGTPFAKKAPAAEPPRPPEPAAKTEPPPSIHVDAELAQELAEADEAPAEDDFEIETPEDAEAGTAAQAEGEPAMELADELPEEAAPEPTAEAGPAPAPFAATLVEKGGASFALPLAENVLGAAGAQIELAEDPYIAPRAATVAFEGDHLVLRDEGSANGVYVKVRESASLTTGDSFIAGERLFRFDGPEELTRPDDGETPVLGAPRPQGGTVRVSEILAGGRTGRTCHRAGPVIAIGRTGCDMNFPSDSLLAPRHAEIRLGPDGTATLVDLGQSQSGVLLRVRLVADLQAGDVVQVGEQQLQVQID